MKVENQEEKRRKQEAGTSLAVADETGLKHSSTSLKLVGEEKKLVGIPAELPRV